jgi:hypothetical protein
MPSEQTNQSSLHVNIRRGAKWQHSPIVMAMLTGNTMRTCVDTEALLEECQRSHSDDRICEAAVRQVNSCLMTGRDMIGQDGLLLLRHEN